MTAKSDKGPLDGILVVDFTQYLSGPIASCMMADNGARVIKVEPSHGDPTRILGTTHHTYPDLFEPSMSASIEAFSRGKESIVLDLKNPEDIEIAKKIAAKADVVFENFRPGVMKHLGLDYETLSKDNPGLIYVSISGYGQSGPYAGRAAFDVVIQATSGFMASTGFPGMPTKSGASIADCVTGVYGYTAAVTALYGRKQTGLGTHCDIAMQDAMMCIQGDQMTETLATGKSPELSGNDVKQMHPFGVFECKDETRIAICVAAQSQMEALADAMGQPQWKEDPRFKFPVPITTTGREAFDEEFFAALKTKTADEWIVIFDNARLPSARLFNYVQIAEDEYFINDRKIIIDKGKYKVLGSPLKFSSYPDVAENLPEGPKLGEHTETLRKEFG